MTRHEISNEDRFRSLVAATPDTVLLHAAGRVVFANTAAARLLGAATPEQLLGRSIADFALASSLEIVRDHAHPEATGRSELAETQMVRLDGEVLDVEAVGLTSSFEGRPATQLVIRDITQRKRTEDALRESERRYRSLFEGVPVGVYRLSSRGGLTLFNEAIVNLLGAESRNRLADLKTSSLYVDAEDKLAWKTMMEYHGKVANFETRIRRLDGTKIWVRCHAQRIRDDQGRIQGYEATVEDITDRKRAEDALRASEERFRSLVQNASDLISILDAEAKVLYHSPASLHVLGFLPNERLGTAGFELIHPQDRHRIEALFESLTSKARASQTAEYRIRHADGTWRVFESKITNLLENPAVAGVVVNSRDVTDRKRAEEQLLHDALHDSLTELPNRTLFMDRLDHSLDQRNRIHAYRCAVLFLDLDRFKMVNDSFGHSVGDSLLVQASNRLKGCLRPNDTLARLGGDEFAILLDNVKDASNAVRVAQRIQQELEVPFQLEGREVYSTASIGIALSDARSQPADVLRDADTAMYRAKSEGRASYAIFDAEMHARVSSQLQLETDLRRALSQWQFEVYYQPIVTLPAGKLAGFEALLRWHHPERGLVLPAEFMPLAEETGLINPIGRGVLAEACQQMKAWNDRRAPLDPIFISVNLSQRQFSQPDLLLQLSQVLDATGLTGDRLTLEVTEGAVMNESETVLETLARIKRLGIRVTLDDFGTGYSSLSVLHRLPFDRIKIDRWFVRNVGIDQGSDELVEGVLALCRGRRLETIAEGVETVEQRRKLSELGCGYAQGFLFSEPVGRLQAEDLLSAPTPNFEAL